MGSCSPCPQKCTYSPHKSTPDMLCLVWPTDPDPSQGWYCDITPIWCTMLRSHSVQIPSWWEWPQPGPCTATPRDLQPSSHYYHHLPQVYSIPSPPFTSFGHHDQSESCQDSAAPMCTVCDHAQHVEVAGCVQQLTLQCFCLTYWPLWWTHHRRPCSSVVVYSSTYQTFYHVLYLFNEACPQTIQYLPSVYLSLACAVTWLAWYSIPPSSHSLWPCNFILNCNIVIMTVTLWLWLQLQYYDYCDFIPRHHCDSTILHSCGPCTMHMTPNITIKGHLRPYLYPLLLWHRKWPQPLGLTVFICLLGVGSPITRLVTEVA